MTSPAVIGRPADGRRVSSRRHWKMRSAISRASRCSARSTGSRRSGSSQFPGLAGGSTSISGQTSTSPGASPREH